MIAITLSLNVRPTSIFSSDVTPGAFDYLRPDGTSYYLRPDGVSYFTRP